MLKSSFCDYSDAHILVKGGIIIVGDAVLEPNPDLKTWSTKQQDLKHN